MAASVVRMTYARVAKGAAPASMKPREHDAKLDAFLLGHFHAMRSLADKDDSPQSRFVEDEAKTLFESLRTGSDDAFLPAAHALTLRLIAEMDGRMDPGLLVCVQVDDGGTMSAGAFKLEVVAPNSAILDKLDSGEEVLSAVTNVMDSPGELQKGALVEGPRAGSDVIVGDRLPENSLYFPRGLGIRTEQKALDAAADLIVAIEEAHGRDAATAAMAALPAISSAHVDKVLGDLSGSVPELDEQAQSAIKAALDARPRPVGRIATSASLKRVIRASGVTVNLPVNGAADAMIEQRPNGGWRIVIDVPDEPTTEIRRR